MPDGAPPEAAGFGNCSVCPLMQHGTAEECVACASQTFAKPPDPHCPICYGQLDERGQCRNRICTWTIGERHFSFVYAVSTNSGELRRAIHRYKYDGKWGWGRIFGRVLAGFLDYNIHAFADFDLIVPSPTFLSGDDREFDHIGLMVQEMQREVFIDWPVQHDVISKTRQTRKMTDCGSWNERAYVARTELRPALSVDRPEEVKDRNVLVIDDVFTGGHTLVEVARALRLAGASSVSEVVLARQTWT